MAEKSGYVMQVMEDRLNGLGGSWEFVTAVDMYTVHSAPCALERTILPRLNVAARQGVHWFHSRPPVVDIEFEMDLRGVCCEDLQ